MLYLPVSASFQKIYEPVQVAFHIGMGIGEGIAYSRLGGQVYHIVEMVVLKELFHAGAIMEVQVAELEILMFPELVEASFLQIDVVVVVEIVKAHNSLAFLE